MKSLTPKQEEIFFYLSEYIQRKWYSPTIIEATKALNYTNRRNITQAIEVLEEKWYIRRNKNNYRNIELMYTWEHTIHIPILWTVWNWSRLLYDYR